MLSCIHDTIRSCCKNFLFSKPGSYHPREFNFALSKPVADKLANEIRRAHEHMAAQTSNGLFSQAVHWRPIAGEEIHSYELDIDVAVAHGMGMRRAMEDDHVYYSGELDIDVAVAHGIGMRSAMEEDRVYYSGQIQKTIRFSYQLFGIIDGHGGDQTALFVKEHIAEEIEKAIEKQDSLSDTNIRNALKEACLNLDTRISQKIKKSGAVATICLKIGSNLWTANVGDCRAILKSGNRVIQLSVDAKPEAERFTRSIEKRGGQVLRKNGVWRLDGVMSFARAFGDKRLQGTDGYFTVSPRPKITKINLDKLPEKRSYLILGSDGIWDVATSKEVASFITDNNSVNLEELSYRIVLGALNAASRDNCSALVARLN